jgi:hypothetical protein
MSKEAKFCRCKKKYAQDCREYNCKYDYMPAQGLGSLIENGTSVVSTPAAPRTISSSRSGDSS